MSSISVQGLWLHLFCRWKAGNSGVYSLLWSSNLYFRFINVPSLKYKCKSTARRIEIPPKKIYPFPYRIISTSSNLFSSRLLMPSMSRLYPDAAQSQQQENAQNPAGSSNCYERSACSNTGCSAVHHRQI